MRCAADHLRLILRFYFLFFLLVLYSTWNNYVSVLSRLLRGNAFERHTRANGKYPEERRPPRYIIPSGFFFVHPVAEKTAKGPTKKKANRSRFHLDGCCFFPFSAFILENLLLLLHTCCRIVHLTQGEFVYRYLMLFRSDWN